MKQKDEDSQIPLLESQRSEAGDSVVNRSGTLWTAVAHIITAVIGSGVLSLSWSVAQLGWIAGPLAMLCFAVVTYISSSLLADCYRSPEPVTGKRNCCYMDAVRENLGEKQTWLCGFLQILSFYGNAVAYVITTATCMRAIHKSNCYHYQGHDAPCAYGDKVYMIMFGAFQLFMSQIPDLHSMKWVSVIAALMSFTYASLGFGLGFKTVLDNGMIQGSLTGVPAPTLAKKLFLVFQALGDVAYGYPYALILLEIQDTIRSPPAENKTMKRASMIAICITTFFYLCCGCFGYAAFGNATPGNLLTGFGFYEPFWLIDFANMCIIIHLIGAYQVFSQPVFSTVEKWLAKMFPNNEFVNKFYVVRLPWALSLHINLLRLCFRSAYIVSTIGLGMLFPYFNSVVGVLGALDLWPLAIYFPVEMYFVQRKIEAWTKKWIVLRTFSFVCFLITIVGFIGSIQRIISEKLGD